MASSITSGVGVLAWIDEFVVMDAPVLRYGIVGRAIQKWLCALRFGKGHRPNECDRFFRAVLSRTGPA
jgi:hypothetical protein